MKGILNFGKIQILGAELFFGKISIEIKLNKKIISKISLKNLKKKVAKKSKEILEKIWEKFKHRGIF